MSKETILRYAKEICEDYKNKVHTKIIRSKYKISGDEMYRLLKENSIPRHSSNLSLAISREQQKEVIRMYQEKEGITVISKTIGVSPGTVNSFLKKAGSEMRLKHAIITDKEVKKIVKLYTQDKKSGKKIANEMGLNEGTIWWALKKSNTKRRRAGNEAQHITKSMEDNICNRYRENASFTELEEETGLYYTLIRSILDKNGIEIRTRKESFSRRDSMNFDERYKSRGCSGYYKEHFFRSLKELCFLIYLERKSISWESGEAKHMAIRYFNTEKGCHSKYFPDFLLKGKILVEVKPRQFWNNQDVLDKKEAAIKLCKEKGWKYKIFDIRVDMITIREEYDLGYIVFHTKRKPSKNFEKIMKFLERPKNKRHKKTKITKSIFI